MSKRTILNVWTALMLSILGVLSSCSLPYCKKIPFSKNDLSWMNPYLIGDTLIFANSENIEFDTVIVTRKIINNPSNTNILNLEGCNWMEGDNEYKANAEYEFVIHHSGKIYKGMFILEKINNTDPAVVSFALMGRYTKEPISTSNIVRDLSDFPQYKWNIIVPESNLYSGKHQSVFPISIIYWNRDAGLIGYKTSLSCYKLIK